MVETKQIIVSETETSTVERNIVNEQCNLVNEFKMKTITKVHGYFHNKGISISDIVVFFKNPQFPGKKKGLKQITTALLNEIIGANYSRIQEAKIPIKELYKQVFELLFPKNRGDIDKNFSHQPQFREYEGKNKAYSRDRSVEEPEIKMEVRERMPSEAPLLLKNKNENLKTRSEKKNGKHKNKRNTWWYKLKIITINLPERALSAIQILNDLGLYPSRSEVIRIALRDFLSNELKYYQELEDDKFQAIIGSRGRD